MWKQRIISNEVCEFCHFQPKTVLHVLWNCEASKSIWNRDFDWIDRRKANRGSFADLWNMVCIEPQKLKLFSIMAWIIWTRRNETQLKQVVPELAEVLGEACWYLSEFKKYNAMLVKVKPLKMVKWKPSNSNFNKTNFNRAFFVDSRETGIGVVVRNARGQVLASLFEKSQILIVWLSWSFGSQVCCVIHQGDWLGQLYFGRWLRNHHQYSKKWQYFPLRIWTSALGHPVILKLFKELVAFSYTWAKQCYSICFS